MMPKGTKLRVCESSTVEAMPTIVINDIEHTGLVTHRCYLTEGTHNKIHTKTKDGAIVCVCLCGHRWIRNFK